MLAMRPRDRGPEPVPVEARAYFSEAQIEKAEAFRTGQLWIYVAQTAIGLGVLVLIVRRPPERLAALRRPVLAGAAVARGDLGRDGRRRRCRSSAVARERAKDVGLVTQDWVGWAGDVAKSQAIAAGFAALGGAVLVFGMRRFGAPLVDPGRGRGRRVRASITTYLNPIVLDPLFNDFKRLPRGRAALATCSTLAAQAGVDVGEVYEMDASRRTTAANAYVTGLGQHQARRALRHARRGLHAGARRAWSSRTSSGHVHHHDVRNGLIWVAIVAPFGMWAVALLSERLAPRGRRARPARGARRRALARDRRAGDHDGLQPALARRRARARTRSRSS